VSEMSPEETKSACVTAAEEAFAIRIENAHKQYKRGGKVREAVRDVSLFVAEGSVHGLLGPNGAGKTSTIKMLLGLLRPTAGHFEILGYEATPEIRRYVGFLPEQPYFPPHLTARQVMSLIGKALEMPASQVASQAEELLDKVGLAGRGTDKLSTYSRGMLQRFGLAQALLGEPRVLVLDEPASGLDPLGQRDVRDLINSLRAEGISILLSSHQLSEVEAVCDEVTILAAGKVASRGRIEDLLRVDGQVAMRVEGDGRELPSSVTALTHSIEANGGEWSLAAPEDSVREVVDALYDGGFKLVTLAPRRESLENYFAHLVAEEREGS